MDGAAKMTPVGILRTLPEPHVAFAWPRSRANWLSLGIVALLGGYVCGGRSFAYLGFRPVYVGEVALLLFLVFCPAAVFHLGAGGLVRKTPFSGVAWGLYFFLAFGFLQCVRGLASGREIILVLQNTVFNVYAVFLFAGIWLGCRHGALTPKIVWWLATCHGCYGVIYVLALSPLGLTGAEYSDDIPWFGPPSHSAAVLVVLLAIEHRMSRLWLPLLTNAFALFAMQVRAEWLGLLMIVPMWGYLAGRGKQVVGFAVLGAGLLIGLAAADVKVPIPEIRGGGEIGTREAVGRALAAVSPGLAAKLSDDPDRDHGTVSWRFVWWSAIVKAVHHTPAKALFGLGYGYPIWDLHPEGLSEVIRTPHNGFIYALGYTGWIGLLSFVSLQLSLGVMMWNVYRQVGQLAGLCLWGTCIIRSSFDNFFEAPHFAIPFFLLMGLFAAPLLVAQGSNAPFRFRGGTPLCDRLVGEAHG